MDPSRAAFDHSTVSGMLECRTLAGTYTPRISILNRMNLTHQCVLELCIQALGLEEHGIPRYDTGYRMLDKHHTVAGDGHIAVYAGGTPHKLHHISAVASRLGWPGL